MIQVLRNTTPRSLDHQGAFGAVLRSTNGSFGGGLQSDDGPP
jgi:hypothetical protein